MSTDNSRSKTDTLTPFSDPEGKFTIHLPWTLHRKKKHKAPSQPYQFSIAGKSYFQLSCKPINDKIKGLIQGNNLISFDPSMPEMICFEDFETEFGGPDLSVYIWMCPVGENFFLCLYVYDPKESGRFGNTSDLSIIRMALSNIKLNFKKLGCQVPEPLKTEPLKNYYDIETWKNRSQLYRSYVGCKDKSKWNVSRIAPLKVDVVNLYTLLTNKISLYPNGFYSLIHVGKPMDNMIWWDFILECDKGFIHIWRTPHILECDVHFEGEFDVYKFIEVNIERYKKEIQDSLKKYEKHTVYINHYMSYNECVESIWREINALDLTAPDLPTNHIIEGDIKGLPDKLQEFAKTSAKYHTLAKSLVLHAAFKLEAFLNLAIRIGSTDEVKAYPDVLKNFLKSEFSQKMKNFGFYSQLLSKDIDLKHQAVQDAQALMTLRNKYVHSDETSEHNRLGEVFFHGDIPLHPLSEFRPGVEAFKHIFHVPAIDVVKKAYDTSNNFVAYIESLIPVELRGKIKELMESNPISYNETRKAYSSIYQKTVIDFFGHVVNEKDAQNKGNNLE